MPNLTPPQCVLSTLFRILCRFFLRTDGIAPLPPAMNARPPLPLPLPRPGQEHAPVRTTYTGISPPRTRLSPCQGHAHVTDADHPQNSPRQGQHAIPSVAGTKHHTVRSRNKKATRPRHGRGKQLSDDNDLIFRCGEIFYFCNGFLSRCDELFDFYKGFLSRWSGLAAFATTFFRVGTLIAVLQQSF